MMGSTHLLAGVAVGCGIVTVVPDMSFSYELAVVGLSSLGSLFPDIDHGNSKISKKVPLISKLVRLFNGHRGLFHTPFFYAILAAGFYFWQQPLSTEWMACFVAFFAGIASHIVLDACTKQGLPLLYPFSKKNYHLIPFPMKTNSIGEYMVRICIVCVVIGTLWIKA